MFSFSVIIYWQVSTGRTWWRESLCWAMEEYGWWEDEEIVGGIWWNGHFPCCMSSWLLSSDRWYGPEWWAVSQSSFLSTCTDSFYSSAKYPLSVVAKLLDTFGADLGGGYDIGCQFKTTLDNSALSPRVHSLNHTCLVGAFHGHAHKHLCQLYHLATYIPGLGLEDLETCERTFSKSNALASTLRYESVFHRQQLIAAYFEHNNEYEVYPSLGMCFFSWIRSSSVVWLNIRKLFI